MKALATLTPLTEERLSKVFKPEYQDEARQFLLDSCGSNLPGTSTEASIERIRCAALKVSRGSMGKLIEAIDLAQTDWRDLLMAADFADPDDHLNWSP